MTKPENKQPPPAATEHPPDPKAVNPFYRGARFSEVARALASPLDPKVRERIKRIRRKARRDNGPPPGHAPDPGR